MDKVTYDAVRPLYWLSERVEHFHGQELQWSGHVNRWIFQESVRSSGFSCVAVNQLSTCLATDFEQPGLLSSCGVCRWKDGWDTVCGGLYLKTCMLPTHPVADNSLSEVQLNFKLHMEPYSQLSINLRIASAYRAVCLVQSLCNHYV